MAMHLHAARHLVARAADFASETLTPNEQTIKALEAQSELYENAFQEKGPRTEVKPWEILGLVAVVVFFMIVMASV